MTFVPMCRSLTLTVIYMPHVVWFVTGVVVPASGTLVLWSVMLTEWYINICTWCTYDLVCDTVICTWCTYDLVCDTDSDMRMMYIWPGLWQWHAHDVHMTWFVTLTVICTWPGLWQESRRLRTVPMLCRSVVCDRVTVLRGKRFSPKKSVRLHSDFAYNENAERNLCNTLSSSVNVSCIPSLL